MLPPAEQVAVQEPERQTPPLQAVLSATLVLTQVPALPPLPQTSEVQSLPSEVQAVPPDLFVQAVIEADGLHCWQGFDGLVSPLA